MQTFAVPDPIEFLEGPPVKHYAYTKTFDEARQDPIVVLHTSGSTSLPKPIILTNGNSAAMDAHSLMRLIDEKAPQTVEWSNLTIFVTFPIFHAGGLFLTLWAPLFFGYTVILPPPGLPDVRMVEKILQNTPCEAMVLLPSTIEEIANSPVLDQMNKIQFVSYGGGPLSPHAGDLLNSVTRVYNCIGATEAGWYPTLATDVEDWQYFHFHPDNGFDMRLRPDGLYDHVIVRDTAAGMTQSVFETFPDLEEWPTKDLYEKHPHKPDHWLHRGRGDDIIVLSNGEKFNPLTIEAGLTTHPFIRSALIFGQGRFQIGALLELTVAGDSKSSDKEEILRAIEPTVEKVNILAPGHAKLSRDLLLIATPEKPFQYASKSTVRRKPTLELYQAEIDNLYDLIDIRFGSNIDSMDTTTVEGVAAGIRSMLTSVAGFASLEDDTDLFALGFDSLQILTLVRFLRASLREHDHVTVDHKLLYSNSTISKLSQAIYGLVRHECQEQGSVVDEMRSMVDRYTVNGPPVTPTSKEVAPDEINVIITGSTGSLGSYLLDGLMRHPKVGRIWCLNRATDAQETQTQLSRGRGLLTNWASKVIFLKADLSQPGLGIQLHDYEILIKHATHILHSQWPVNFNLPLSSFEPQVAGVRQLLNLAAASKHYISLFFVSSVSVAAHWPWAESMLVPETVIIDLSVAGMGYGEGKLVSEAVLDWGAKAGLAHTVTCRVGQIAGPVKGGGRVGRWNRKEWFPAIIDTSATLGVLPRTLGQMNEISWIPVDFLADIILELAVDSRPPSPTTSGGVEVFHTINAHRPIWESLLLVVKKQLAESGHPVEIVDWKEWVHLLNQAAEEVEGQMNPAEPVPGVKLLDFFKGIGTAPKGGEDQRAQGTLDIQKTRNKSRTLGELDAVGEEWMRTWMMQWGY
ncbi:hypothetical protein UA08_05968 [Talaromyces atroroseus]|uniref:Carrier domain-containing protein n=1 Tax=Talaromyces atroroseus TaxID=1441469 RepID=A0A225AVR5_TALAT|nr:hypothetical protein UA08_05968 [Talaromyces atroroseus]OKL59056.1 hypothetical protein UA08_05968 [Talaromyces atroroseus]